jgi:hypothetical protein
MDLEIIQEKIYIIRGRKVMIDSDLAKLYGVETKVLNQAVRRNLGRFPDDFMFELTSQEMANWKSQIVTSNPSLKQSLRKKPLAFTEQGIAMLSSVLRSEQAIQINIHIIRVFTKLRQMIDSYKEIRDKIEEMERENKANFEEIFAIIKLMINEGEKSKQGKIGFNTD